MSLFDEYNKGAKPKPNRQADMAKADRERLIGRFESAGVTDVATLLDQAAIDQETTEDILDHWLYGKTTHDMNWGVGLLCKTIREATPEANWRDKLICRSGLPADPEQRRMAELLADAGVNRAGDLLTDCKLSTEQIEGAIRYYKAAVAEGEDWTPGLLYSVLKRATRDGGWRGHFPLYQGASTEATPDRPPASHDEAVASYKAKKAGETFGHLGDAADDDKRGIYERFQDELRKRGVSATPPPGLAEQREGRAGIQPEGKK